MIENEKTDPSKIKSNNPVALGASTSFKPTSSTSSLMDNLSLVEEKLKTDIRKFVDNIFTDSQSISLEKKAEFGRLVRDPAARFLFAVFVDDYRVNSKKVSELTFYSLAQHFSIVLLECLLAEDFRPAKIIMNMMFTYYYEPTNEGQPFTEPNGLQSSTKTTSKKSPSQESTKIYLYTLLKDQQIFKSIRFWTSAFYESVINERSNHSIFGLRDQHDKTSNEQREEELDCSKNISFGLLGSFIYNMSLLELSQEFCEEFLEKHSTIADLTDEQLNLLRANMKAMYGTTNNSSSSKGDRFATFLQKLSTKLNERS